MDAQTLTEHPTAAPLRLLQSAMPSLLVVGLFVASYFGLRRLFARR